MVETAKPVEETKPNATETEKKESADEAQDNFCSETFNEPVLNDLKLTSSWTLWEHYDLKDAEWHTTMCKVCWFNDLISFGTAWSSIPHRELSNVFYNDTNNSVKL